MSNNLYDVIVVGAGPGGTTVAALLANEGKRVLLVDKNARPGGRMMTINKNGFSYELFPINCVPQHHSLFEKLSAALGKQDDVKLILGDDFGIGEIHYADDKGQIRQWQMRYNLIGMKSILGLIGVKPWDIPSLLQISRISRKLLSMKEEEIATLYHISAMEYFDSLGKCPKGFRTFLLGTFGEGVFEMTSDRVAAGEMVKLFQLSMKDSGGRYYEGGVGHFFEVMATAVTDHGGTLLMNTRVKSVDTKDGAVIGITTEKGEQYRAAIVVSNAGIRQTVLKLVGEEQFSAPYVDKIKSYENNLACVGYRYFTSKPILKSPMIVYFPEGCVARYREFEEIHRGEKKPDSGYIYLGTTSLYPNMAPDGKQVVYAVMSCVPDPEVDPAPYLEYIEKGIRRIAPELYEPGVIERTEIMDTAVVPSVGNDAILPGQGGEAYGIANSLGQAGPDRPGGDTPVKGLYIVGNDAAGFGLGTHQAVDSGFKIFEMLCS